MLVRDPRKRPDAATILGHEWMQGGSSAPEAPMQPEILQRMRRFANMNRFKKEALRVGSNCIDMPRTCSAQSPLAAQHLLCLGTVHTAVMTAKQHRPGGA